MKEKKITLDDVIGFIVKNCDNIEMMDKINKVTFPFTTNYRNYTEKTHSQKIRDEMEAIEDDYRELVTSDWGSLPGEK